MIICDEMGMDNKSMIYCDETIKGGEIVILRDNVLCKKTQNALLNAWFNRMGVRFRRKHFQILSKIINGYCWDEYDQRKQGQIYNFEKMPRIVDKLGHNLDMDKSEQLLLEYLYETGADLYSYEDWKRENKRMDKRILKHENVIRFL